MRQTGDFTSTPTVTSYGASLISDASQILLEWFYFHGILSTVTSTEQACIYVSAETMDALGVSGATEILPKCFGTKPLSRSQVNTILSTASDQLVMSTLKPNQLMEALTIEKALHDISLQYSTSQQSLVAQCFRLAASLMLHFTVHPTSPPSQGRAWDHLTQLLKLVEHISEDDSAVTCSLFPFFICGVSVVREVDCQLVLDKVQAYSRYCRLAHTHDVINFLPKWWEKRDELLLDGTDQTRCQCSPDLTSERCERCEAATIPRDWWMWREFMQELDMDLILI